MKKTTLILTGILISIICCYLSWISCQPIAASKIIMNTRDTESVAETTARRYSIAFILGEDKEADNPYYNEAFRYYTTNPDEKTDFIIRTCRSMLEVKKHLERNQPANGVAWGTIHLVSHGNQWTGLSVKVTPDSKRATTQRIIEYVQSNLFEPLEQTVVDTQTKIFLHGCGVGNNQPLVEAISFFFGGRGLVFAPKLFEYYASVGSEENLKSQRYMARNWFVSYPMGVKPSPYSLASELREKYPDVIVDWQGAVTRKHPRWIGDVYHYTFEVPARWIIPVDAAPDLSEENLQIKWLHSQQIVVNELKGLQIPIEKFKWSLSNGYTETKAGLMTPAVFVKGHCTMWCVLQALTDGHEKNGALQKPFTAELTDTLFYYSSRQAKLAPLGLAMSYLHQ